MSLIRTASALLMTLCFSPSALAQGEPKDDLPSAPPAVEVEIYDVDSEYEYEGELPAAPAYEVMTPGYPHEQAAYGRPYRPRKYRVPYEEGMEIPQGGQIVKRRKWGLAIPGAVLFAIPYFATVAVWSSDPYFYSDGYAGRRGRRPAAGLVPVIGPFIALGQRRDEYLPARKVGLVMSGTMQLAGVTMLAFGLIGRQYLVYYADVNQRRLAFQLTPIATREGGGAGLNMTF